MTAKAPATGSVTSQDGTTIGYRQFGDGPGVVLVHGAMQSSANFVDLGRALSDSFTVYVPDRRGRGMSGPAGEDHTIRKECEDIAALLEGTDAHHVFGLSSGAVIALRTARTLPTVRTVAAYEPPLFTTRSNPTEWGPRYEREIAQGKLADALVTVGNGTKTFPPVFRLIPRFLLVPVLDRMLAHQRTGSGGDEIPFTELIPTMQYDLRMLRSAHLEPTDFADLSVEVLLLKGSKSPAFLRETVDELRTVVPHSTRTEFAGLSHTGPDNDGEPERVAEVLRHFIVSRTKK